MRAGALGLDPAADPGRFVLAGVVGEALLGENLVGPRRVARDRERGRAVAGRRAAGEVLDRLARGPQIRGELVSPLAADGQVLIAVAADLVTGRDDVCHQAGMGARRHPEDEERRLRVERVEQAQEGIGLRGERRPGPLPVGHPEPAAHELVPVLEVDAEEELSVGGRRGPEVTG